MGVDLHKIGFSISSGLSRNGFGSIVSFPSGASYPAYGTEISRDYYTPYTPAGVMVVVNGVNYYSQYADFVTYADGAGGTFTAWENINNYATSEVPFATLNFNPPYPQTSYYDFGGYIGGQYTQYYTQDLYLRDATGSYNVQHNGVSYYSYGTYIAQSSTAETMYYNGTSGPVPTGRNELVNYLWDGNGGYYTEFVTYSGSYYSSGTIIEYGPTTNYDQTSVSSFGYFNNGLYNIPSTWIYDGMGGSSSTTIYGGSYYPYGTYITSDPSMGNPYYWDGNGGYYMG